MLVVLILHCRLLPTVLNHDTDIDRHFSNWVEVQADVPCKMEVVLRRQVDSSY